MNSTEYMQCSCEYCSGLYPSQKNDEVCTYSLHVLLTLWSPHFLVNGFLSVGYYFCIARYFISLDGEGKEKG